jgi:hypothetical protein
MRRFLDFPVQAHLERALRVQRCPTIASVPSSGPYATQSETPKESVALCPRELTGENSPHLYRGEKTEKPHQQNAIFLLFYTLGDLGDRVCDLGFECLAFICWRKPL